MDRYEVIYVSALISAGVLIGVLFSMMYPIKEERNKVDGLWLPYAENRSDAILSANEWDNGEWVCLNIKNMDYKRAIEVCDHEVGHSIFANVCENNMSKCMDVLK